VANPYAIKLAPGAIEDLKEAVELIIDKVQSLPTGDGCTLCL
jgi:hypothetical protein